MDSASVLHAQHQLRQRLLTPRAGWATPAGERDLAAHLMLYLDDAEACWRIALDWLRDKLGGDRVDSGALQPLSPVYQARVQSLRQDREVPSMLDTPLDLGWPGIQAALRSTVPVWVASVEQSASLGDGLRAIIRSKGTCSKLAMPLLREGGPFGIVCADWLEVPHTLDGARVDLFHRTVLHVVAPVLSAALALEEGQAVDALRQRLEIASDALTPAEWRVAHLVAMGLSYKEIARQLGRSLSTVDHQLRSIRSKLDVPSTARLVSLLAVPGKPPSLLS